MAHSGERRWRRDVRPDYRVRSIHLGGRLVDLLMAHPDGLSLDELTRALDASKTTVYRALYTLADLGHIDPVSPDLYRLGPRLLPSVTTHVDALVLRATPHLGALARTLAYTVAMGVLDASAVTVVAVEYGGSALQVPELRGARIPLHAAALGKVLAATLDDDEVRAVLQGTGMPARTARTCTDPRALLAELAEVRDRGWAVDDREYDDGLRGVAVGLPGRRVVAGLALMGPAAALPPEELERFAALLSEHADHIVLPPGPAT